MEFGHLIGIAGLKNAPAWLGQYRFIRDFDERAGMGRRVERVSDNQRDRLTCVVNSVVLKLRVGLSLRAQVAPRHRAGRRLRRPRISAPEVSAIPKTFPHSMMSNREIRQRIAGGKVDQLDLPTVPVA
jgi:hypothetical protein